MSQKRNAGAVKEAERPTPDVVKWGNCDVVTDVPAVVKSGDGDVATDATSTRAAAGFPAR